MPSDKSDPFTQPANGEVASSYFTDGRWNLGGWATYVSPAELAASGGKPGRPASPADTPKK